MNKQSAIHHYPASVAYSEEDECFIARIPAFRHCSGHGETPEKALHEAYEGLRGIVAVMKEDGTPLPDPDETATRLRQIRHIVKISSLAKLAGMRPTTLASKIDRGGPFTPGERARLHSALEFR